MEWLLLKKAQEFDARIVEGAEADALVLLLEERELLLRRHHTELLHGVGLRGQ